MTKPVRDYREEFAVAMRGLQSRDAIGDAWEHWPGCYGTTPTRGWNDVARQLCTLLPGQIWPGRGGVSWVCGRRLAGRVVASTQIQDIERSRETLRTIGLNDENYWSIGRMARDLLSYVCPADTCPIRSEHLQEGIELGYHTCTPGNYPDAAMYDVSAYYYSLLSRAPSLRVVCGRRGSVVWGPMSDGERGRLKEVLTLVQQDKILRNSLVGCAMGATGRRLVYMRDKTTGQPTKRRMRLPGGPFRGLGLLIMRSGYEITSIESLQSEAVYSTIDSVVTQSTSAGKVWRQFGLEVRQVATGDAEIIRRGCWRVGDMATEPHALGFRGIVPVPAVRPPDVQYHRAWL